MRRENTSEETMITVTLGKTQSCGFRVIELLCIHPKLKDQQLGAVPR